MVLVRHCPRLTYSELELRSIYVYSYHSGAFRQVAPVTQLLGIPRRPSGRSGRGILSEYNTEYVSYCYVTKHWIF